MTDRLRIMNLRDVSLASLARFLTARPPDSVARPSGVNRPVFRVTSGSEHFVGCHGDLPGCTYVKQSTP